MTMEMIFEAVKAVFEPIITKLNLPQFILALTMAIAGVVVIVLARRITRVFKRNNDIRDDDKFMLGVKFFGLILIFIAVLIVVIQSI